MKILIVSETYHPRKDGIATFIKHLAEGLAQKGHKVYIWVPGKKITSYLESNGNLTVYREKSLELLFYPGLRVSYWPFQNAEKLIRTINPDLIHIQDPFLLGVTALFIANKYKVPVVTTSHIMPENILMNIRLPKKVSSKMEKFFWQYLIWFHNKADIVTAPTLTALSLLEDRNLKKLGSPITNGVNTKIFNPSKKRPSILNKFRIPKDSVKLIFIGRIDGEKRIDVIVRGFAESLRQQHNVHLIIAGTGKYLNELQALSVQLGIEDNLTFTGFVKESDKPHLLASCDIFVIASPAELQSIATLEAMSSGLPVVAVDKIALRELCHDGVNGYMFKENDHIDLSRQLLKLIKNRPKRVKYGAKSREIVEQNHDINTSLNSYLEIYKKIQIGKE